MHPSPKWSLVRRLAAALLAVVLSWALSFAGSSRPKPLGTIEQARHARVHGGPAVSGAAVYAGDAVQTDNHGAVRLRLGKGRLYLSASSSASLEERAGLATLTLARGSAIFSLPDPTEFELETPAGILRGSGTKATRGQVTIMNAKEIVVSATEGALVLDNNDEFYTIAQGKSYRIVVASDSDSSTGSGRNAQKPETMQHPKRKLLLFPIRPTNSV